MELIKRLLRDEEGQDIVEYTLMIGLVVLVIWVAIKTLGIPESVSNVWSRVNAQLSSAGGS